MILAHNIKNLSDEMLLAMYEYNMCESARGHFIDFIDLRKEILKRMSFGELI
jgi:hypothetical protein